jgi:hypothetical protein
MILGVSFAGGALALVLVNISLYASAALSEASMLGLFSADVVVHFVGEEEIDLSMGGLGLSAFCAMEEGFLLNTFREDFPLSSGRSALATVLLAALPNPNLDAVPAFACGSGLKLGGSCCVFDLGSPVCTCLFAGGYTLLPSICPEICAMSASLCSFIWPGVMYCPILLLLPVSPGLVGGSNPDL